MEVRIRVGAALDSNVQGLYRPLVESAKRARQQVQAEFDKIKVGAGVAQGAKDGARDLDRLRAAAQGTSGALRDTARAAREAGRTAQTAGQQGAAGLSAIQKAAIEAGATVDKRLVAALRKTGGAASGGAAQMEKAYKQAIDRTERHILRIGRSSMQNFSQTAKAVTDVAKDIARGAGVDFGIGSSVRRSVALDKTARDIANSAAIGQGRVATQKDVDDVRGTIIAAGDAAKLDYGEIGTGLQEFLAKTGDLETGKAILSDLGDTARATAADFAELASMAGDVAKNMPEGADKAEKVLAVVRLLAKQGAQGNVEVRDYAKFGGRIAAGAQLYEGDLDKNIGRVGAMAQIAAKGRAVSAAEATNTAQAFARDVTKNAALKRFKALGVDVFSDESKTALRDPKAIMKDFLSKSGGNLASLAKYFQNDVSKRLVEQVGATYNRAEKEKKGSGLEAVDKLFDKFSATLSKDDVAKAAALSKSGDEARAQDFQNKLDKIGIEMASKLLPALEKLEPSILKAAEGLAKLVEFGVENPGEAILLAITGSIAKASIGAGVRGAIEAAIRGLIGGPAVTSAVTGVAGTVTGATGTGVGGTAGLGALAGPIGAGLAVGVGAMAYEGYQDWEKAREEREARAKTATAILDDPRQRINAALRASGIDVPESAGKYAKDERMFAATSDSADEMEKARWKLEFEQSKAAKGGSFPIQDKTGLGLMVTELASRTPQPDTEWSRTSDPRYQGSLPDDTVMREQSAKLSAMVTILQQMPDLLSRIASNTGQGPPQPTGGRFTAEGDYVTGR